MSTLGRGGEEVPNLGGGRRGEERGGKRREKMGRREQEEEEEQEDDCQPWEESDQNIPQRASLNPVFYRVTHLGSSFP